jgi:hypothetical protein
MTQTSLCLRFLPEAWNARDRPSGTLKEAIAFPWLAPLLAQFLVVAAEADVAVQRAGEGSYRAIR